MIAKANMAIKITRGPLFKGNCCHPLSPHGLNRKKNSKSGLKLDQLKVILSKLGRQLGNNSCFITDPEKLEYVHSINMKVSEDHSFADMGIFNPDLEDVLGQMLQFNPYFRPSAKELLNHRYFDDVRTAEYEQHSLP